MSPVAWLQQLMTGLELTWPAEEQGIRAHLSTQTALVL